MRIPAIGRQMKARAVLIGNSDGIGLATTRELLRLGWDVRGISRSRSPIDNPSYKHVVADVRDPAYTGILKSVLAGIATLDVCIYCAGVGELLDPSDMNKESDIFEVNLMGLVRTASCVIPMMVRRGGGHFVGLSSVADEVLSPDAPSACLDCAMLY